MCRIQIIVAKGDEQDTDAFIGYDWPLRTYFLQGFLMDYGVYDDFELWLGTDLEEYPTLEGIIEAAESMGYRIGKITPEDQLSLLLAARHDAQPCLAERIGWFSR